MFEERSAYPKKANEGQPCIFFKKREEGCTFPKLEYQGYAGCAGRIGPFCAVINPEIKRELLKQASTGLKGDLEPKIIVIKPSQNP